MLLALAVVTAGEVFLEPNVETDEKITATHLAKLEFGLPRAPIAPRNWDDRPRIASNNRLQRQFDGEIKVWGDERTASINRGFAIGFEGVSRIVQFDAE